MENNTTSTKKTDYYVQKMINGAEVIDRLFSYTLKGKQMDQSDIDELCGPDFHMLTPNQKDVFSNYVERLEKAQQVVAKIVDIFGGLYKNSNLKGGKELYELVYGVKPRGKGFCARPLSFAIEFSVPQENWERKENYTLGDARKMLFVYDWIDEWHLDNALDKDDSSDSTTEAKKKKSAAEIVESLCYRMNIDRLAQKSAEYAEKLGYDEKRVKEGFLRNTRNHEQRHIIYNIIGDITDYILTETIAHSYDACTADSIKFGIQRDLARLDKTLEAYPSYIEKLRDEGDPDGKLKIHQEKMEYLQRVREGIAKLPETIDALITVISKIPPGFSFAIPGNMLSKDRRLSYIIAETPPEKLNHRLQLLKEYNEPKNHFSDAWIIEALVGTK